MLRDMAGPEAESSEPIYTQLVTLWMFLGQVVDSDPSCRQAVARLLAWLTLEGQPACCAETGAYCKARVRLSEDHLHRLVQSTGAELHGKAQNEWLWKGRCVKVADGTTAIMPDNEANQAEYPQPDGQKPGLGFPMVRLVAIFCLATGALLDAAAAAYSGKGTGELSLLRSIWDQLQRGEVLLADRLYCSWFEMALLQQRGVDVVLPRHPLVIRNTDMMLGTYNSGTFTPLNANLTPGQEYYLALECNGGGASAYTLWVNNVLAGTVTSGFNGSTYYPTGLGASGGRVHDVRVYNTSPVNHEALEIWQGGSMVAINNDVLLTPCTAGTTYQIRTTPLGGQGAYFPFNGNAQNSLGLTVNSYNSPTYTNDPSPDPGSVQSLQLYGNSPYLTLAPDGGFETPAVANYAYNPTGGAWTYVGYSGLIPQGSGPWGVRASGYGNQYGFVQMTGYCYETISNMAAGTYTLTLLTTSRPGYAAQDFNVLIDGAVVGYFNPASSTTFSSVTTSNFTVTAGNHVLEFQGVDSGGGDRTAFLDNVMLAQTVTGSASYNNYLDILDSFVPTSYTVSVWVKVPVVQAMGIIGRTTSAGLSSGVWSDDLHITSAGVFEHYTSSGSAGYTVTGTTVIQPNTWYHVAIVAGAGGQELLYVNGVSQGTPNTIPSLSTVGDRWQVGTPPPGYNYFNGELGGLAIYHNTALATTQIAALASGSASPLSFIICQAQFLLQEFNPMEECHNIDDPKTLTFTNTVATWNLPNGTVSSTNYMTGDSCFYVEGSWGPEYNWAGITTPGGDLWYTFTPPVTNNLTITDPYSAALNEYLVAFSPYSTITGTSPIARNWASISFTANGGQQSLARERHQRRGTQRRQPASCNPACKRQLRQCHANQFCDKRHRQHDN